MRWHVQIDNFTQDRSRQRYASQSVRANSKCVLVEVPPPIVCKASPLPFEEFAQPSV